jgi:HEAT repeat protein
MQQHQQPQSLEKPLQRNTPAFNADFERRLAEDQAQKIVFAWKAGEFEACLHLLERVKRPLPLILLGAFEFVLLQPHPSPMLKGKKRRIKRELHQTTRLLAIDILQECPVESSAPLLVPLLSDLDPVIVAASGEALAHYGERAIPALTEGLSQQTHLKNSKIRWSAAGANAAIKLLGKTYSPDSIPILKRALKDDVYVYQALTLRESVRFALSLSLLFGTVPYLLLLNAVFGTPEFSKAFYEGLGVYPALFVGILASILGGNSIQSACVQISGVEERKNLAWKALLAIPDRTVLFSCLPLLRSRRRVQSLMLSEQVLLREHLEQVDEEFAAYFGSTEREALHTLLDTENLPLLEAVLHVLLLVGNYETKRRLRQIQAEHPNRDIRYCALLVLENLILRLKRQEAGKELLRPSGLHDDPSTLLRPSHESRDPQEQLLRPRKKEE